MLLSFHRIQSPDITVPRFPHLWAATWENVPSNMCAQRRLKSACASAQSDQSLRCPHEETLYPWLSKLRPLKILIRLCRLIWIFVGRTYSKVRFLTLRLICRKIGITVVIYSSKNILEHLMSPLLQWFNVCSSRPTKFVNNVSGATPDVISVAVIQCICLSKSIKFVNNESEATSDVTSVTVI